MRIAISGLGSAGATSTAKRVSQRLQIPLSSYTLRDLAEDRGVAFEVIHGQAKKHDPSIDRDLDIKQIEFLNKHSDAIVASDLSCWLDDPHIYRQLGLSDPPVIDLKIWLEVSLEERARRFAEREGGSEERLAAYDQELADHYRKVYGIDFFDHSHVDWVFDTTHIDLDGVVEAICQRIIQQKLRP